MKEFILYIIKSGISLSIFLLIYQLFLRSTTFFKFNRIYLIVGLILSFVIPTISYTYDVYVSAPQIMQGTNSSELAVSPTQNTTDIWFILFTLYSIGFFVQVTRNLYAYYRMTKLIRKGHPIKNNNYYLVDNQNIDSPFTILNYIFLNSNAISHTEKDLILKHEKTHIHQKHWLDLLGSECMLLLQWFNPLAWFYVSLQKENHEFLADKAVIDSGTSPALYQAVLINQRLQGAAFSFSNSFNRSNQLNRLVMIKKMKSSPWKRLSVLAVVPFVGLYLWASATPNYVIESYNSDSTTNDTIIVIGAEAESEIPKNVKVITKVIHNKDIDQPNDSIRKVHVTTHVINGKDKPVVIVNGEKIPYEKLESLKPEDIKDISVIKDPEKAKAVKELAGENTKTGVIIINTKESKHVSDTTIRQPKKIEVRHVTHIKTDGTESSPMLIVDGIEKSFDELKAISPDKIESISVFKGDEALKKYGEKGKAGVISVILKK